MFIDISFIAIKSSIKYIELITAIIATIYFYKYNHSFLKYFLIILWFTVIIEFVGYYFSNHISRYNAIIYNIYHVVNFTFLFLLFKKYVKQQTHKKWILLFLILYLLSFFINMFYQNYFIQVQTIPFIVAAIFISISILFYFLEILNTNKVLFVSTNLLFWISIGLLLYHIGKIPTRITRNYYEEVPNFESIFLIEYLLSVIMNICFIIGFIWSEKVKQY